ncbi:MAG: cell envelope integrity protein TolA [Gammaproteobacteria bacterium]
MPPFLREHMVPMGWATGLHVALAALLTVSFALSRPPIVPPQISIKARVVDESAIRTKQDRQLEEQRAAQRRREEQAAQDRREAEREQQRLDQLRVQQEQAAETARQRELAQERERKQAAEQERQRQEAAAAEAKRKEAAAEAKRKADEAKKLEAQRQAEAKRKAEERRKQEEAARRQAALESDLARELEAEDARLQAERSGELGQYIALIQQRVTRNWIRPPEARAGLSCELFVSQIPGGEVVSVRFGRCNGDDVVRRSIEVAVFKASPLPKPPNPALFERNLVFEFKPE